MIIKFEYYWKCIRIYEKAHLISDFTKKYLLRWGSNPRNETKPEEIYDNERVCIRKLFSHFYQILTFIYIIDKTEQVTFLRTVYLIIELLMNLTSLIIWVNFPMNFVLFWTTLCYFWNYLLYFKPSWIMPYSTTIQGHSQIYSQVL